MPTKGFLLLVADQADEVVIVERSAHRNGGLRLGWLRLLSSQGTQGATHRTDQITQVSRGALSEKPSLWRQAAPSSLGG
jgi:hypothetical protein